MSYYLTIKVTKFWYMIPHQKSSKFLCSAEEANHKRQHIGALCLDKMPGKSKSMERRISGAWHWSWRQRVTIKGHHERCYKPNGLWLSSTYICKSYWITGLQWINPMIYKLYHEKSGLKHSMISIHFFYKICYISMFIFSFYVCDLLRSILWRLSGMLFFSIRLEKRNLPK